MADPAEAVTGIFVFVVSAVLALMMYTAYQGGNITRVSEIVGELATPFMVILVILFFLLALIEQV